MSNGTLIIKTSTATRRLALRSDPVFQGISEFITAVRQGSPNNDDRNLANFASFEDARGGIGVVVGDIREDFDKLADSDGLIHFRPRQAIKPPIMSTALMSGATASKATNAVVTELSVDATLRMYIGFGNQLWYSNGTTAAVVKTTADPWAGTEKIGSVVTYTDPVGGTRRGYVAANGAASIAYFVDPTAGSPFTQVATPAIVAESLFTFDGKLWALGPGTLESSINPSVGADWATAAATGAWPNRWRYISIFPFGTTYMPYVLVDHHLPGQSYIAVLDVDNNTLTPVNLGITGIIDAYSNNGDLVVVHDQGREVTTYDTVNDFRRVDMDWQAAERGGFLPARVGAAVSGFAHPRVPFVVSNIDLGGAQLFMFKTTGWHPYGRITTQTTAIRGAAYIPHLDSLVIPAPGATDLSLAYIKWSNQAFVPGRDMDNAVETVTMYDITPWHNFGFADIDGILLAMHSGGYFDALNQVTVDYEVDFSGTWVAVGTFPGTVPPEPEITGRTRAIASENTLLISTLTGIQFSYVRFRIGLVTDASEPNQTPNAFPMTLRFFKRPDLRESGRVEIDVAGTIEAGDFTTADDIWKWLKVIYDMKEVPELTIGSYHTWAALIAIPRVVQTSSPAPEDIVADNTSFDVTIVANFAELM